jgi:hypothetical protein
MTERYGTMPQTSNLKKAVDDLLVAIEANGGPIHKPSWCQCDPGMGGFCEYCAIYQGLRNALQFIRYGDNAKFFSKDGG